MSLVDTDITRTLARYLDLTSYRESVVANNIANLDTPGYKTRDVNFADELKRLLQDGNSNAATPQTIEVPGLIERPDANNVNMDREGLLLGQTQLQFHAGVELLRSQLKRISMAVHEGNVQ